MPVIRTPLGPAYNVLITGIIFFGVYVNRFLVECSYNRYPLYKVVVYSLERRGVIFIQELKHSLLYY